MYPSYDSYSGYPSPMTYPSYDMYSAFDPNFPYYANPSYRQPKIEPPNQHIKHNTNYWCPLGWIRIFILLSTLGGIIASWCVVSNDANFASIDPGLMSTRAALIVMFSVFFSLSLFQFLMSVSNFVNLPGIDSKYYLYAVIRVHSNCFFFRDGFNMFNIKILMNFFLRYKVKN